MLDSADIIAVFAKEMSEFLKTSELTKTRAFVRSFVKEVVKPRRAAIIYSLPTPDDSPIGGADAAEVALKGQGMSTVRSGGAMTDAACHAAGESRLGLGVTAIISAPAARRASPVHQMGLYVPMLS